MARRGKAGVHPTIRELDCRRCTRSPAVGGATIFYLVDDTVYRNANGNGSGGELTSYANSFYTGTFAIASTVETLPTISAAQNRRGVAATDTQLFDTDGNLVW